MIKVFIMSSAHSWEDPRIFYKEAVTLKQEYDVELHAQAPFSFKEINGVKVFGLSIYKRRIFRIINWFRLFFRAIKSKAQVFHFHDPELIPLGLAIRYLKRKIVIYDIHEHNEATLLTRQWIPKLLRKPTARFISWMERRTAGRFNGLITVDPQMHKEFAVKIPKKMVRNFPLLSFGNKDHYTEIKENSAEITIIYVGVMSKERGLETIMKAMPLVRRHVPEARCILVGRVSFNGLDKKYGPEKINQMLKEGNIQLLGQVRYEEVKRLLQQSNIAWIPFPPIEKHRFGIGTKLVEYMAMQKPVVASGYGEGGEVVKKTGCGITVQPDNPREHVQGILELIFDPALAKQCGLNGYKAFTENYNWEQEANKLLELYSELLYNKQEKFFFKDIKADWKRAMAPVRDKSIFIKIARFIQKPGLWAVLGYRLGRRLYQLRFAPFRLFFFLYQYLVLIPLKLITGIEIFSQTEIGSGFYIEHYGGIFIAPTAKIGKNCTIFQGVTIGADFKNNQAAQIGNNVKIGAGAKIIGNIVVGENVVVGANAVVTRDIPANSVVVGVPARIIGERNEKGSE